MAWSAPLEISHSSSHERSTPRIVRGASGSIYVVYVNKGSPWQVYFRSKSPASHWGPIESIPSTFSTRPDVAEDGIGRPHVLFAATNTSGALDLVHAFRGDGPWSINFLTATSANEDQPHLAGDANGKIHMVFTRSEVESSAGEVVYRVWNGASWEAETILGSVNNSFYHRPDISVDSQNTVHITWIDKAGSLYKVRYRKWSGGSWSATMNVGSGAEGASFPNYAKIAAPGADHVVVVWHDNTGSGGSNIVYNHSSSGGANWAFSLSGNQQGQTLYAGHYPTMIAGAGAAHLVSNLEPGGKSLVYSRWNGSAWSPNQQLIASNSFWKGWPDIAAEPDGAVHVVWDEPYGSETSQHYIAYSTTASDNVPPAAPAQFTAEAQHGRVVLSWKNPADPDVARTIVRSSTSSYPASETDGEPVADRAASPASSDSIEHAGLTNGTTYYYAAFARDIEGLHSPAIYQTATPYVPPDMDHDGDVDQTDFAAFQRCLSGSFQPQTGPDCRQALFDSDNDVDGDDAAVFLACLSGPDVLYLPECADAVSK